jgi:hypothetical protein
VGTKQPQPQPQQKQKRKETTTPTIKIQKKGAVGATRVAISRVQTWEQLLALVPLLFPSSSSETPEIQTFTGELLLSASDYAAVLQPDLHVLISYPSDLSELASLFGHLGQDWSVDYDGYALAGVKPPGLRAVREPERGPSCTLLPPTLWFYPPGEVRIAVVMENAGLPKPKGFARWNQEVKTPAIRVTGPSSGSVYHSAGPGNVPTPTHRPVDTWGVLSQRKRMQVLQQVCVEFTASPSSAGGAAALADVVSAAQSRALGWALPHTPRAGEKRVYVSYDKPVDAAERQGWWMCSTALMNMGFSGGEGERSFVLTGIAHAECFLTGFLTACGVGATELMVCI